MVAVLAGPGIDQNLNLTSKRSSLSLVSLSPAVALAFLRDCCFDRSGDRSEFQSKFKKQTELRIEF